MEPDAPRRFRTTRWSLVVAAADSNPDQAQAALADLCRLYWSPVYAFVRRSGRTHEDAADLTQAFFARILEKGTLAQARQERGRFRTFLLTVVKHFLANAHAAESAMKRGGGHLVLSLELDDGERQYVIEPTDPETPDRIYERRWAMAVLETTTRRLEAIYRESGRADLFAALRPLLTRDGHPPAEVAATLGVTGGNLRVILHRMRGQFGACLREVIQETVEQPEDVDDELRHLLAVVSR